MRLFLCAVALVMVGHPGTSAIILRSRNANANVEKATRFVGIGYNLLRADPDAAGRGGVDPGFLVAHRLIDLDTANYEGFPRQSCVSKTDTSTVYDEKSYQKKFDIDVAAEVGVEAAVAEARFSLSTSFKQASAQTTKSKVMMFESQTLCNLGRARLKTELKTFKVSQGFQAAVCQLPDSYDRMTYARFIDKWGTNYVSVVEVGVKTLVQKKETFSSVFQDLQRSLSVGASASGSYNGAIVSVSGSIEMNMNMLSNSQQLKEAFKGKETTKKIGTEAHPEPISVRLGSLGDLVTAAAFGSKNPAACSAAALGKLAAKRANILRGLRDYPGAMHAIVNSGNGKAKFRLNWPKGTYGLTMPRAGCPAGWSQGTKGFGLWIFGPNRNTAATGGHHFAATFPSGSGSGPIYQKYCMKTHPYTDLSTDMDWPKGEYCIYKYRTCPKGFTEAKHSVLVQGFSNIYTNGPVPEGIYGRGYGDNPTHFCCRKDGHNTVPIFLPTSRPFYLIQYTKYGCQRVAGMRVRSEWIRWMKVAGVPDKQPQPRPYVDDSNGWRMFYCYYYV